MKFEILYFTPVLVSLIWTVTFMLKKRSPRQTVLTACLCVCVLYFISYGINTMPNTNYRLMVRLEPISLPLALLVAGALMIYANMLLDDRKVSPWHIILTMPCIILASILITLSSSIGVNDEAMFLQRLDTLGSFPPEYNTRLFEVFHFVEIYLIPAFSATFIIMIISQCLYVNYKMGYKFGDIIRFLLRKKDYGQELKISLSIIIVMLLMVPVSINNNYVMTRPLLGIALATGLSIVIHFICYCENNTILKAKIDETARKAALYDKMMEEKNNEVAELEEEANDKGEKTEPDTLKERRAQSILSKFKVMMEEERVFLNDDINIADIAVKLGVGRTTLSSLLNNEYGTNFRGIINNYRIEYAKNYLKENPNKTQEQVAFACGFKDASAYSHKFKEITGKSPLTWLVEQKG